MSPYDYFILFPLSVVIIIGIYQFYFWCQRNNFRKPIEFNTKLDDYIPFYPSWIWVYSGIYYPVIVLMIFTFKDMRQFNYTVYSFLVLLVLQMIFFVFLPVKTPNKWRELSTGNNWTHRFLRYVQSVDQSNNCFPSMHVSVSTLTSLHLLHNYPFLGNYIFLFPAIIGVSALLTKQHYFYDLIPGTILGLIAFQSFQFAY